MHPPDAYPTPERDTRPSSAGIRPPAHLALAPVTSNPQNLRREEPRPLTPEILKNMVEDVIRQRDHEKALGAQQAGMRQRHHALMADKDRARQARQAAVAPKGGPLPDNLWPMQNKDDIVPWDAKKKSGPHMVGMYEPLHHVNTADLAQALGPAHPVPSTSTASPPGSMDVTGAPGVLAPAPRQGRPEGLPPEVNCSYMMRWGGRSRVAVYCYRERAWLTGFAQAPGSMCVWEELPLVEGFMRGRHVGRFVEDPRPDQPPDLDDYEAGVAPPRDPRDPPPPGPRDPDPPGSSQ
jgi:hypothetical protein